MENLKPNIKLTVILRNDSPLLFCGDSPSYRSITIELTDEQKDLLKLRETGINCGQTVHESISKCFIEENE